MKDFFRKKMEEACPKYSKEYEARRTYEKAVSMLEVKEPWYASLVKEITKNIPEGMEYGKDYKLKVEYSEPECNSKSKFHMSAKINIVKK